MIQALQITPEILASNTDNINFDTVDLRTNTANCCGWLQYMPGSSDFTIIGGGLFEVSFNANVTSPTAGPVAIALKSGTGSDYEGTEVDTEITTPGVYENVSFTKLIRLCPRVNTTISVGSLPAIGSSGTPTTDPVETVVPTVKDAQIIIRKVCGN